MSQRIAYIDRLKGFAMLAVVFGHVCLWCFQDAFHPELQAFVSSFHMPLFMFLSGLMISAPPVGRKALAKFIQFMLPVLTVGVVYICYIDSTLAHYLVNDSKGGYWYLFVLAAYYLLLLPFHLTARLQGRRRLLTDIGLAFFILLAMLAVYVLLPKPANDLLTLYKMINFWPAFMLGFFFRRYQLTDRMMRHNWIFSLCLALYVCCMFIDHAGVFYYIFVPMGLVALVVYFWLFKSREHNDSVIERELARIGRGSLDVYIYQYFFLYSVKLSPLGRWFVETDNVLLEVLTVLVFAVIITYVSLLTGWVLKRSLLLKNIIYGEFTKRWY